MFISRDASDLQPEKINKNGMDNNSNINIQNKSKQERLNNLENQNTHKFTIENEKHFQATSALNFINASNKNNVIAQTKHMLDQRVESDSGFDDRDFSERFKKQTTRKYEDEDFV